MKIPQRLPALLTAAALMLHAAAFPVPKIVPATTAELSAHAEQLCSRIQTPAPFSALCYNKQSGRLLCDGTDTGTEYAGFSAESGVLSVRRDAVLTQAERDSGADAAGTVTLSEAAEKIGCVYTETAQGIEIRSPFQTCTLIVRADGAFDPHGAAVESESINGLRVLHYPTPADTYAAYQTFSADSSITLAEPELIYHIRTENDPHTDPKELTDGEWGYEAVGCDEFKARLDAEENEADPICVAVLDTGIYAEHAWFRERIAEGACSFVADSSLDDDNSHGTHCAGIIARSTRENVSLLPLKVLDETGYGTSLQIYYAMLYAAEQGADVVSMSIGCDGLSLLMQDAVQRLQQKGIPVIAAAGNDARDVKYENPANIRDVISVSAVTDNYMTNEYKFSEFLRSIQPELPQNRYQPAAFSNFGDGIDFAAPGDKITSAYLYGQNALSSDSGTSMAAPFVAACFANLLDYDRNLTHGRIFEILKANAIDLGEPGFDSTFGWGMITLADLVFTSGDCPRPVITPECDKLASDVFDAEITASSPDAEIFYTTDGSIPSRTNGIRYDGTPVRITHETVLKAVCMYGDRSSAVEKKTYLFNVSMPFTDATPGHYYEAIDEMKLYGPEHSKIYYTLDGSVPDPEISLCYDGESISIEETAVLSAIAVIGEERSMVYRAVYEIGGKNRDNLLILNGTVLEGCFADDSDLNLKTLAGDRVITEIAPYAFESNDILRHVTLPDSVRVIGESAFANCHALESVTGKGVTEVRDEAFHDCPRLTAFTFGAVTEYGKKCFRKCSKLTLGTPDFSRVTTIGDYAFAETKCSGTFNLPSLRSLGAYAFMQTGDIELILPDTLDALPDGVCMKTASLKLTATGVTRIGASALETEPGKSAITVLNLPWESLTTLGAYAFSHADLNQASGGQIFFSSLTNIGQGAFLYTACRGMCFPALKVLPKDAFSGVKAEVLRFDAAETARADALIPKEGHPCCILFSDRMKVISEKALGETGLYPRIHAPAGSYAAEYCTKHSYNISTDPTELYLPAREVTCRQGDALRLTAIPLGIGLCADWQTDSKIPEETAASANTLFADTDIPTDETGRLSRFAVLRKDGKPVGVPQEVTIEIFRNRDIPGITETGKPVLFSWADLYTPAELAHVSGLQMQANCTFTAPHTGYFACYANSDSVTVTIRQDGKPDMRQPGSGEQPGRLSAVLMQAGEKVTLIITCNNANRTVALTAAEELPIQSLASSDMQTAFTAREYKANAELPAVSVTDGSSEPPVLLKEGRDYVLLTRNADGPGITELCAVGINSYSGMLTQRILNTEACKADQPVTVGCTGNASHLFRFVPPADGTYLIQLTPQKTDDPLLADPDVLGRLYTSVRLYSEDFTPIETQNTLSPLYECCCTLKKDTPVYLEVTACSGQLPALTLTVSPRGERQHLADARLSEPDRIFTGDPAKDLPEIEALPADPDAAGIPLKAGTDYQAVPLDALMPGTIRVFLTGTGSFCGHALLTYSLRCTTDQAVQEIEYNKPFGSGTGTAFFRFRHDYIMQNPVLTAEDGTPFTAFYYPYGISDGTRISIAENVPFLPSSDGVLAVRMQDGKSHKLLLRAEPQYRLFSEVTVEPAEAEFTGRLLRPVFRVTDHGEVLTEHQDYEISPDAARQSCGEYTVTLHGVGKYRGIAESTFTVTMPDDSKVLQRGTGDAEIPFTESGSTVLYRWIPASKTCCIDKYSLPNAEIVLADRRGFLTGRASGAGRQSSVFAVKPGETYYLIVSLAEESPPGTVHFYIGDDLKDISRCTVRGEDQLPIPECTSPPDITVYDGSTLLEEDTDYTLLISDSPMQPGCNVMYIRGTGCYTGELHFTYYCIPQFDDLPFDGTTGLLTLEEEYPVHRAEPDKPLPPGHTERLRFIAPEDGTYYLNLTQYDSKSCSLLLYASDKTPLGSKRRCFTLKKDETLWIESMINWPESDTQPSNHSKLKITLTMPEVSFTVGGYEYLTETIGACLITKLPENQCGFILPESVFDPETGITAAFDEIFCGLALHGRSGDTFIGTTTFYGIPGGRAEAFCAENGYCFCSLEPECSVRGDLTGDGSVNADDAATLFRWIAEGGGMMLPGKAAEAADLDGDGIITMADYTVLLRLAGEP